MKAKLIWLGLLCSLMACQSTSSSLYSPSAQPSSSLLPTHLPSASSTQLPSLPPPIPSPSSTFVDPQVEIVAGNGQEGFTDGPASEASFHAVSALCHDPRNGELFILDTHKVRKLGLDGQVITIAGSEPGFLDGPAQQSLFLAPQECVVNSQGELFILDSRNSRIRKISTDRQTTSTLLFDDKHSLGSITISSNDMIFLSDSTKLYKYAQGQLQVMNASPSTAKPFCKGEMIDFTPFTNHNFLTADDKGNIYRTNGYTNEVCKIEPSGMVTQVSQQNQKRYSEGGFIGNPQELAYSNKSQLVLVSGVYWIYKINAQKEISYALKNPFYPLTQSTKPATVVGLSVSPDNFVYYFDTHHNQIKRFRLN